MRVRVSIAIFALLTVVVVFPLSAFDPPDGRFSSVRGEVTEVIYGNPTTVVRIDAGSGPRDFFCYETYSPGILNTCNALAPGNRVVASGDFFFGTSWITFLVTRIDKTF